MKSFIQDVICPICKSNNVKVQKVNINGVWFNRCISGKRHGSYSLVDGSEHSFEQYLYFTSENVIDTKHGLLVKQ
jgi:hypothetical protein